MDILQNPIIIGLLLGAVTYGYMYWEEQQRQKNNPKASLQSVGFMTPVVVAVLGWFLASNFFDSNDNAVIEQAPIGPESVKYKLVDDGIKGGTTVTKGIRDSFEFVGFNEVKLPHSDVFIDLARF